MSAIAIFRELTLEERAEIEQITDEGTRTERMIDAVRPGLQPLWSFFVALCHALQEGENELTPVDAYWFGLIDEVIGSTDLAALRLIGEHVDDPPPAPPTDEGQAGAVTNATAS